MRRVNRARRKKLRAKQFGTDGKREWILAMRCAVTGKVPVDPAHVLKSRGAGGGPEGLVPLSREIHRAFDSMGAERFEEVYGVSKDWIREKARHLDELWNELPAHVRAAWEPPEMPF